MIPLDGHSSDASAPLVPCALRRTPGRHLPRCHLTKGRSLVVLARPSNWRCRAERLAGACGQRDLPSGCPCFDRFRKGHQLGCGNGVRYHPFNGARQPGGHGDASGRKPLLKTYPRVGRPERRFVKFFLDVFSRSEAIAACRVANYRENGSAGKAASSTSACALSTLAPRTLISASTATSLVSCASFLYFNSTEARSQSSWAWACCFR
jgi:hypothetical protein